MPRKKAVAEDASHDLDIANDPDIKKCLTAEELQQLEFNLMKQNVCRLEMEVVQSKHAERTLQKRLYEAQAETLGVRIELLNQPDPLLSQKASTINSKLDLLKEDNAQFVSGLKEKYDVTGEGFGYDPDTGEIAENTEEED